MAQMSNYLEEKLINHVLRNAVYTPPATIYIALYTTDPTDADVGAEVSTTGTGYARQSTTFISPTDGVTSNTNIITFPVATSDWGTIKYVGIRDSLTGGNLLLYGQLNIEKPIMTGDQFRFLANNLTVKFQ